MALRPVSHKDLRSILAIFVRHCRHTMASFGQLKAQFRDPVNGYNLDSIIYFGWTTNSFSSLPVTGS